LRLAHAPRHPPTTATPWLLWPANQWNHHWQRRIPVPWAWHSIWRGNEDNASRVGRLNLSFPAPFSKGYCHEAYQREAFYHAHAALDGGHRGPTGAVAGPVRRFDRGIGDGFQGFPEGEEGFPEGEGGDHDPQHDLGGMGHQGQGLQGRQEARRNLHRMESGRSRCCLGGSEQLTLPRASEYPLPLGRGTLR